MAKNLDVSVLWGIHSFLPCEPGAQKKLQNEELEMQTPLTNYGILYTPPPPFPPPEEAQISTKSVPNEPNLDLVFSWGGGGGVSI